MPTALATFMGTGTSSVIIFIAIWWKNSSVKNYYFSCSVYPQNVKMVLCRTVNNSQNPHCQERFILQNCVISPCRHGAFFVLALSKMRYPTLKSWDFFVLHCQKCAFGNASALSCIGEPNSQSKICKPRNDAFSPRTVNKRGNGKRHRSSALSNMFDVSTSLSKSNTVRNVISLQSLILHSRTVGNMYPFLSALLHC